MAKCPPCRLNDHEHCIYLSEDPDDHCSCDICDEAETAEDLRKFFEDEGAEVMASLCADCQRWEGVMNGLVFDRNEARAELEKAYRLIVKKDRETYEVRAELAECASRLARRVSNECSEIIEARENLAAMEMLNRVLLNDRDEARAIARELRECVVTARWPILCKKFDALPWSKEP